MSRLMNFYRSFTGRMIIAAVLMHALLVPFLVFGIQRILVNDLKDEFVDHARAQAQQFAVLANDKSAAAIPPLLEDWLVSGQVVFAEAVFEDGTAIRLEGFQGPKPLTFVEDFQFGEHGDEVYFITAPLKHQSLRGQLRLGFDEHPVNERIEMLYRRGLLLVGGYLAVAVLLAWGGGTLLGRSIRQLRDATRRFASGQIQRSLSIKTEITEISSLSNDLETMRRELLQRGEELRSLAYYDSLTGLPNRWLFNQRLTEALAEAQRRQRKLAVLYLDLDRFKRVNDTLGHSAGDELLRGVAERLQHCLRGSDLVTIANSMLPGDSVARLGGDEFTLLLSNIQHEDDVARVARRILEVLNEPLPVGGHGVYVTTSIGIALYPDDGVDPIELMKNADMAMYFAKEQGKNCFRYYTPSINQAAEERLDLENALHRAIAEDQLLLHYQPQIDMRSKKMIGAEALIRWQHPERGLIAPNIFIQIAEESGLIIPIGDWVIRTACAQLQRWRAQGLPPLCLSVNVSAKQFQHVGFVQNVKRMLEEFEVEPGTLGLEITETALMANEEDAIERLRALRALGVELYIDDFGTGYSSLSYLKRFPVQTLKIDQSFIHAVPDHAHSSAIIQAILALARSMNLNVIAEGIETQQQWEFLFEQGCQEMQGFLISKPLPADAFTQFVADHASDIEPGLRQA
ncbi:MAG: EAL domain-containing protein [Burkholderiaceae bacterium]|nr:MAG: EAL domain-containing protein [Burkholderiaceae bacterium]